MGKPITVYHMNYWNQNRLSMLILRVAFSDEEYEIE